MEDFSKAAQNHLGIADLAKEREPAMGVRGDEICSSLGIIISGQAYGSAMVDSWVEIGHGGFVEASSGRLSGCVRCRGGSLFGAYIFCHQIASMAM